MSEIRGKEYAITILDESIV